MRSQSRPFSRRPARRRAARPGPAAWLAESERLYRDFVELTPYPFQPFVPNVQVVGRIRALAPCPDEPLVPITASWACWRLSPPHRSVAPLPGGRPRHPLPQQPPQPTFRTGVTIVPVDVRVLDREGKPVTDLKQSDFVVLEDGSPQDIRFFSARGLVPTPVPPEATPAVRTSSSSPTRKQSSRIFLIVLGRGRLRIPVEGCGRGDSLRPQPSPPAGPGRGDGLQPRIGVHHESRGDASGARSVRRAVTKRSRRSSATRRAAWPGSTAAASPWSGCSGTSTRSSRARRGGRPAPSRLRDARAPAGELPPPVARPTTWPGRTLSRGGSRPSATRSISSRARWSACRSSSTSRPASRRCTTWATSTRASSTCISSKARNTSSS